MERGAHQAHSSGHVGLLPGPHQPALAPGQQGRLDEPRAPELSGARAHGGCNRGGSGQGRSWPGVLVELVQNRDRSLLSWLPVSGLHLLAGLGVAFLALVSAEGDAETRV